ncbi:pentapeptide repeat-containing protein [Bradyrhizobium barranii subsp. barranii]|uniref:Pentapeptide repeat-containing protein n=1 Tax=Bradyrhizobium barranii subsp. barranii TaxID=2823807 RepID=A0A939LYK7_9BRAD|nr:pentapeptide repeat-containing protein [Bradyrhizobium barranii]UEM12572.1 pentapeptide repeat-containing protein [Bradyrhizobium barranii subsp. barranii]
MKVPLLSIELPLLSFYLATPAVFVTLHFYVLVQLRLMADKVSAFVAAVEKESGGNPTTRALALKQLDSFAGAQLLALRHLGKWSPPVQIMVWATFAVFPVLLLLFIQLQFLPYHSVAVTWWHRANLLIDLALLWLLWSSGGSRFGRWQAFPALIAGALVTSIVVLFSVVLATVPDESADGLAERLPGSVQSCRSEESKAPLSSLWQRLWASITKVEGAQRTQTVNCGVETQSLFVAARKALFDGPIDDTTQRETSLFSRRLILPDENFVPEDEKTVSELRRTRVLRGRDLRYAVLDRANLRKADFTGARMEGVSLVGAQLREANLKNVRLRGASLDDAEAQDASFELADLRGAFLTRANLQSASFVCAQLRGAWLLAAQLQGASMQSASLQGANLSYSKLQGAVLQDAELQGANLEGAELQGISFVNAQLQGAVLQDAKMKGASLQNAQVWRTTVDRASARGWSNEVDLNDLGFAQEPPEDGNPCAPESFKGPQDGRAVTWEYWTNLWMSDVPEGKALNRMDAITHLKVLTAKISPLEEKTQRANWPKKPAALGSRRAATILATLACDGSSGPHVARGIIAQLLIGLAEPGRFLDSQGAGFASRLANTTACAGSRQLSESDRRSLAQIATGRPF